MSIFKFWTPKAPSAPAPQITVTNCTFLAVGKQAWGPAVMVRDNGLELANSVIASPDLLKWRYFVQYKTRNWRRILKKGK